MSAYHVHTSLRKLFHPSRFTIFRRPWDRREVMKLPYEYQKFYTEWMESEQKETPIHWVPMKEKWTRNPETGEVKHHQNIQIPVNYPIEMHEGIWGGEGVVQGTIKRGKYRSPVPRYWSPLIKKSVVYSEVLDTYFSVVVTERALRLIDQHHGLDSYLMMTPAYDLKSLLALKLKRCIMVALMEKDFCKDNPTRQEQLLEKFQEYMIPPNELEWYGLSVDEAIEKVKQLKAMHQMPSPLKDKYRAELIEQLKLEPPESRDSIQETTSWMKKLNPFSKGEDAQK